MNEMSAAEQMKALLEEEKELSFASFDSKDAWKVGQYLVECANQRHLTIGMNIIVGGRTLFHYMTNQTLVDNENWLRRKRNTVLHFGHSTLYQSIKCGGDQGLIAGKYGLNHQDFVLAGGGFPIVIQGTGVIGAICVSGLKPEEDHALVVEALAELKRGALNI